MLTTLDLVTKSKPLPSQKELQEKFNYDPETGQLTWKISSSARIKPGDHAGHYSGKGYLIVKLNYSLYRAHRIIWKLAYGEDPPADMEIDHINRNGIDNRLSNLRLATRSQNSLNSDRHRKPVIVTRPNNQEVLYPSITAAAKSEGLNYRDLQRVVTGRRKHTKGHTARFTIDPQP